MHTAELFVSLRQTVKIVTRQARASELLFVTPARMTTPPPVKQWFWVDPTASLHGTSEASIETVMPAALPRLKARGTAQATVQND